MSEPIFFEIPIYRCSLSSHKKEMQSLLDEIELAVDKEFYPISHKSNIDHFHSNIWFPWKYNEIVGYLNLYIFGNQFRADVWFIDKKRINRGIIKKRFKLYSKTLERSIPKNITSSEIFSFMVEELIKLNKREYKKHYFDLSAFIVAGKFINWSHLIDQLNSFKYPDFRNQYLEERNNSL